MGKKVQGHLELCVKLCVCVWGRGGSATHRALRLSSVMVHAHTCEREA